MKLKAIADNARGINKIIKKLSNKHWFETMLDNYLVEKDAAREKIRKERFSPSLAANCPRYIQFLMDAVREESAKSGQDIRRLDNGTAMHERYIRYCREMGILVSENTEILLDNPPIHGYIDLIIKAHGKEWLVELKSRAPEVAKIAWEDFKMPTLEHIFQWNLYAKFNGPQQGFLLYENKASQKIKVFDMALDEQVIDRILTEWNKVIVARSEGLITPIPDGGCPNPMWCSYRKHCSDVESKELFTNG